MSDRTTGFNYKKIREYYDKDYWDTPGVKSGYTDMTAAIGGDWHRQACAWFNSVVPVSGKKLFDAGCGLGHFMVEFAELGAGVFGCDISDYCLATAGRTFGRDFFHTSLEDLQGVPLGEYDILFCSATLEHVPIDLIPCIFENFVDLLRPGGIAYIEIDTKPDNRRDFPEESHINIRPWSQWLRIIFDQRYSWIRDLALETALKDQLGFPGFPCPDWSFTVAVRL